MPRHFKPSNNLLQRDHYCHIKVKTKENVDNRTECVYKIKRKFLFLIFFLVHENNFTALVCRSEWQGISLPIKMNAFSFPIFHWTVATCSPSIISHVSSFIHQYEWKILFQTISSTLNYTTIEIQVNTKFSLVGTGGGVTVVLLWEEPGCLRKPTWPGDYNNTWVWKENHISRIL